MSQFLFGILREYAFLFFHNTRDTAKNSEGMHGDQDATNFCAAGMRNYFAIVDPFSGASQGC
jgi:hypothetical protein